MRLESVLLKNVPGSIKVVNLLRLFRGLSMVQAKRSSPHRHMKIRQQQAPSFVT